MLRKNVENGIPAAICQLGSDYTHGSLGLVPSHKKAARLYQRAVALGDVNGDGFVDLYVSNLGQANQLFLGKACPESWDCFDEMETGGTAMPNMWLASQWLMRDAYWHSRRRPARSPRCARWWKLQCCCAGFTDKPGPRTAKKTKSRAVL